MFAFWKRPSPAMRRTFTGKGSKNYQSATILNGFICSKFLDIVLAGSQTRSRMEAGCKPATTWVGLAGLAALSLTGKGRYFAILSDMCNENMQMLTKCRDNQS